MPRLAALLLLLACSLRLSADEEPRVPLPPAEDVEKATKLVRELFKDEYAKTTSKARAALAAKLLKQAEETGDDPAARFALLREAADVAATVGEVDLTLAAVDALYGRYAGVKAEQVEPTLKMITVKAPASEAQTLANFLLKAVDDAVTADELNAAERLAKLAEQSAIRSKNVRTAGLAAARVKEVEAFKKEAEPVQAAQKALGANPNDATAAGVVGRYCCFQKGSWERGLPLLAASDDAKLKLVADKELAGPKEPTELVAVGDGWYDLGKTAPAHHKRAMLSRAHEFYTKAAPDLTGLTRTRVDKRLEELEKVTNGNSQHDELFAAARAATRSKEVENLEASGGFFAGKDYRDAPPAGGVLIGFRYGLRKYNNDHDIVSYLQPIYLTPHGEKTGLGVGKAPAKPLTVKAKPGYAVGAVKTSGGGLMGAYGLVFMKIQGKGLNPNDKYESPVMGWDRGLRGGRTSGDGRPVVGVYGKWSTDGADVCSIGVVVPGKSPKK
ncbi:MAG TPA: hypothetical protein VGE74_04200 [Gemmata sp.]